MPTLDGRPKIFIGGECSGRVRNAIWKLCPSAYVVSVDHKPAEDGCGFERWNGGHMIHDMCDAVDHMAEFDNYFDAGLWHPECTYLTNAAAWAYKDGPYHQKVKPETLVGAARRAAREEQLQYIERIGRLPIKSKILENPAKGALTARIGKPKYVVHPYMFGDDASKETGLWCTPDIVLTIPPKETWFPPRWVSPDVGAGKFDREHRSNLRPLPRWGNQTDTGQNRETPGPDRPTERSRTFPGIAKALAVALLVAAARAGADIGARSR